MDRGEQSPEAHTCVHTLVIFNTSAMSVCGEEDQGVHGWCWDSWITLDQVTLTSPTTGGGGWGVGLSGDHPKRILGGTSGAKQQLQTHSSAFK